MWFPDHAWLVPLIPAVSFVVILLFGKRLPRGGSEVGILAVATSFVLACATGLQWINHVQDAKGSEPSVAPVIHSLTWFQSGGFKLSAGIDIDGLAVVVMFVVTLVSLLVHIYSTEYMRGDVRYTYFFACLSLFTASMLLLVVADNTLEMLVGWELVGLCSFMLIGHWWEEKPNSDAALKAFLTTRTGDIGLLTGVIMTFFIVQRSFGTGSFDIQQLHQAAAASSSPAVAHQLGIQSPGHTLVFWCAAALMLAIVGKSGQFALHTWLPDAMAGPTPVSALIHAATMVVAGVYLGARLYPVFFHGFSIGDGTVNPMAVIGGTTVIIGAALAFVQDDIKKVLAYSTISQLGYMVMALGVGAWTAAIFHLFTHAFFKADLFLGAGSVSHSGSHHSFDMKKDMGGLRKYMPQTFWTFLIGTLALAGIFPFAGFWSKDEILVNAGHNNYVAFVVVGLIGALMTAAYMTRCIYLTFFGEYRGGHGHEHHAGDDSDLLPEDHAHEPHESNGLILAPLWILTFLAVVVGFLNFPHFSKFEKWFQPSSPESFKEILHGVAFNPILALGSVAIALLGIGVVWAFYAGRLNALHDLAERNKVAHAGKTFLVNKYYLDYLYENIIVAGIKGPIAAGAYWFNQNVIDNVLNYTGRGARAVGRFTYEVIDQKGVDGLVNGIGTVTSEVGSETRKIQTGRLQFYALMLVAAVVVFALILWIAT